MTTGSCPACRSARCRAARPWHWISTRSGAPPSACLDAPSIRSIHVSPAVMMADERADGRMRLTLLGGFLGSGKTTWLRHQLHAGLFPDAHVIVNEAAATPVDDALLAQATTIEVLAGGCACCEARSDLIERLRRLCDLRSRSAS